MDRTNTVSRFCKFQVQCDLACIALSRGKRAFQQIAKSITVQDLSEKEIAAALSTCVQNGTPLSRSIRDLAFLDLSAITMKPGADPVLFEVATAILLSDAISRNANAPLMDANWDAFLEVYMTLKPGTRAGLVQGYRLAASMGRLTLDPEPAPNSWLTEPHTDVVDRLEQYAGHPLADTMCDALLSKDTEGRAAALWRGGANQLTQSQRNLAQAVCAGMRHLSETQPAWSAFNDSDERMIAIPQLTQEGLD